MKMMVESSLMMEMMPFPTLVTGRGCVPVFFSFFFFFFFFFWGVKQYAHLHHPALPFAMPFWL
jgi:hypothetical protein